MRTSFTCLVLVLFYLSFFGQSKIKGISFVAPPGKVDHSVLDPVTDVNANYVTLMPYAYGNVGSDDLNFDLENWQWWGERLEGVKGCIEMAQSKGLKVMIKPHIWFRHGSYTGHFELNSEESWQNFEAKYREFILLYAALSQEYNLPIFCIGTELDTFAEKRPEFWRELISKVRLIYDGQLTYAGNWDSYKRFPCWRELDMIGVDAYFPLCKDRTPSQKGLQQGWKRFIYEMEDISGQYNKPIVFTEWGYRSADYCAREPWDYSEKLPVNHEAQCNAYNAVFQLVWNQPWFAGGFVWKWFDDHHNISDRHTNRFTPQNKPAEVILKDWYSKL